MSVYSQGTRIVDCRELIYDTIDLLQFISEHSRSYYALLNSSTERKSIATTTDTLAKPAVLAISRNSCNVRSLAPGEACASIIRSMRNATADPAPSSDCSNKSGSTESTAITFPPLAGNALKQLRKIVKHSESFQSCKTHCQSAQFINDTHQELHG
jgi:hypothetical protein